MSTYIKFQGFVEHLAHGVHNFDTDAITVALTNTAPDPALSTANTILSNITEISYTYCGSRVFPGNISIVRVGYPYEYKLGPDTPSYTFTVSASGGSVGPFRYGIIYNDTPSSPLNPLIAYYDYGSSITLNDGESILFDFDPDGTFTIL